ncbi:MAG: SdiA-regulated domain-containing protein [Ferruginibacter sp.]
MRDLKLLTTACILMFITAISGCKNSAKKGEFRNSDMYDISKPHIINLPQELDEISGIAYYAKDTSVFAIVDEDGLLFKVPIKYPDQAREWRFEEKKDFEDLILKDSIFYTLVSNGNIIAIKFEGSKKISTDKLDFGNTTKKENEFESLYFDDSTGKMIVLCKDCEDDKKKKVSSFYYDDSSKSFLPYMEIDVTVIAKKLKMDKLSLKPSAAAINPVTKDLYILCSVSKLLVITDRLGNFKDVFKLNPEIYKQPEGLAFTPAGDLIISNEVYLEGYATLLILKNKKKGK